MSQLSLFAIVCWISWFASPSCALTFDYVENGIKSEVPVRGAVGGSVGQYGAAIHCKLSCTVITGEVGDLRYPVLSEFAEFSALEAYAANPNNVSIQQCGLVARLKAVSPQRLFAPHGLFVVFGLLWVCMGLHGSAWACMGPLGSAWACMGPLWSSLVCCLLWSNLVCTGLLWSGLVCFGLLWSALAQLWPALVCMGKAWVCSIF